MEANTNDKEIPGPAYNAAPIPVKTKIPVPITLPIPIRILSQMRLDF